MADGNYGERSIFIDLTVVGAARVIRDATANQFVKISAIHLQGVSGATNGVIRLRKESASGSIIYQFQPGNAQVVVEDKEFSEKVPIHKGLYMDDPVTAWAAGSSLQIDTA